MWLDLHSPGPAEREVVKGHRAQGWGEEGRRLPESECADVGDSGMERDISIPVGFVYLGLDLTFVNGPLSSFSVISVNRFPGNRTELITELFGSSFFGFGYFGLIFSFRLNLPRASADDDISPSVCLFL